MFSDILKIIPKLDNKDLQAMEKALQSRFTKLAKGFGKGLLNVVKGGGIAAIGIGLIDKILNPLKEVQEAIDKTLKTSDDLATNAGQFNTSTGKLFKLVQLAKATGLDQDNLFQLITKFQTAVAQAKANPNDDSVSSVRNYVNQTDTAEGFFNFINELKKMDKNQQVLVQQQVFGEKQILRMADFLQTDFGKLGSQVGLDKITSQKLTTSIEKLAGLNDLADALAARRETNDIVAKSGIINQGMITARDRSEQLALQKENQRISTYENLAKISDMTEKITGLLNNGISMLGQFVGKITPAIDRIVQMLEQFAKSPAVRGIRGLFGGDK